MPELLNLLAVPMMWVIASFWAMGVYVATEPGMILWEAYEWLVNSKIPARIQKPLLVCPPCIAGFQSIPLYIGLCCFTPFEYNLFLQLVITVPVIFITKILLEKYEPNTDLYEA
jgi:hypothetical protein